jgi:hypothetical protein
MLQAFFASGTAVDLILGVLVVEFIWLVRQRGARAWLDILLALGPGAMILLALRAALTGAGLPWIGLALAASFPVHLADLHRRGLLRRA